jgi:hypothetical protein
LTAVVNDVAQAFSFEPSAIASLWMMVNECLAIPARRPPAAPVSVAGMAALLVGTVRITPGGD